MTGLFLTVSDNRLLSIGKSPNTDPIKDKIDPSGGGCYLSLYTGAFGIGEKVGVPGMLQFWKDYEVPDTHIAAARAGRMVRVQRPLCFVRK